MHPHPFLGAVGGAAAGASAGADGAAAAAAAAADGGEAAAAALSALSALPALPALRVCEACEAFLGGDSQYTLGEDGTEEFCRCCGQGGKIFCCERPGCHRSACGECLSRYFGVDYVTRLDAEGSNVVFACFNCRPGPVLAAHAALLRSAPREPGRAWGEDPRGHEEAQRGALEKAAQAATSAVGQGAEVEAEVGVEAQGSAEGLVVAPPVSLVQEPTLPPPA